MYVYTVHCENVKWKVCQFIRNFFSRKQTNTSGNSSYGNKLHEHKYKNRYYTKTVLYIFWSFTTLTIWLSFHMNTTVGKILLKLTTFNVIWEVWQYCNVCIMYSIWWPPIPLVLSAVTFMLTTYPQVLCAEADKLPTYATSAQGWSGYAAQLCY